MIKNERVAKKILTLTSALVLIVNIIGAYFLIQISSNNVTKTFMKQNETLLRSIAVGINLNEFREVVATGDMNSQAYKNIHDYLAEVKISTGAKFLYTLAYGEDKQAFYVVDASDMGAEDFCEYGDPEESSYDIAAKGEAQITDIIDSEQWGKIISVEVGIFDEANNLVGVVASDIAAEDIVREKKNYTYITAIIMLIITATQLGFTYLGIQKLISKPFESMNKIVDETSHFNFTDMTLGSELSHRSDEIGQITNNLINMRQKLRDKAELVNTISTNIFEVTEDMHTKLGASTAATEQINLSITELAEGVNNQVMQTTESYDMLQLLSTKIEDLVEQIGYVNKLTIATQEASVESSVTLDHLTKTIQDNQHISKQVQKSVQLLDEHSKKIEDVVGVIEGITRQTNLLALNAAIEASRAGEAGKGFGVVSDEIKGLSEDTFKSTEVIKEIVGSIVEDVQKSLQDTEKLMNSNVQINEVSLTVERAFKQTEETMQQILQVIKELIKYTDEIRSYKDNVNAATESLTTQAQQYSAITEEIASTTEDETEITRAILQISEDLKVAAEHLSETVVEYKL